MNRRVILQDGSAVLSHTNENLNNSRLEDNGTSIDEEESMDPWQFRPKHGCRYLRVRRERERETISKGDLFCSQSMMNNNNVYQHIVRVFRHFIL